MAYVLEFVDEPAAEDTVFEDKGVKVVSTAKACNSSTALSWTSLKKA
jgi:Fe-S cluster assembly iron-binding protein IscA